MRKLGFGKAASIAALVASAAIAAAPAQKASAQVTGAGASSVTTLADLVRTVNGPAVNPGQIRYVVTGSGAGRNAFLAGTATFAATDGLGNLADGVASGQFVAFQEATLNVAFPYNVPGFNGENGVFLGLTAVQGCQIIAGSVTNWNQVNITPVDADGNIIGVPVAGPNLPIVRVVRGDNSGTTDTLNNGFIIPFCEAAGLANRIPNPPAPGSFERVVAPAADPFNSGDDDNPGSYTLGVLNTVSTTAGAIGYAETAAAKSLGLPIATDVDATATTPKTIAVGPTFVVFRASDLASNPDAQNACLAFTDADNVSFAGFSADEIGPDAVSGGNPACFGL